MNCAINKRVMKSRLPFNQIIFSTLLFGNLTWITTDFSSVLAAPEVNQLSATTTTKTEIKEKLDTPELTTTSVENYQIGDDDLSFDYSIQSKQQENIDAPMSQITDVSELSDVQPSDWAYTALQSLIQRYGGITGYSDNTFRGNRALTRYEFAASFNAMLNRIQEFIAAGTSDKITTEDLDTLRRLQAEFATELTTLRGRIDTLETHTAELKANQFSTTTKLNGLVSFNIVGATTDGSVKRETGRRVGGIPEIELVNTKPNITFSYQTVLGLNTSFTGKDSLVLQLSAGNSRTAVTTQYGSGGISTLGLPLGDFLAGTQFDTLTIFDLYYSFPITESFQVTVGPRINWLTLFDINRFTNPYAGGAGSFNAVNSPTLLTTVRGAGAVVSWKLNEQFTLSSGYLAESNEFLPTNAASDPTRGLFGSNRTNSLTAMLTYSPSRNANIRFTYVKGNQGTNQIGQIFERPIIGLADDGLGGPLKGGSSNAFSVSADWLLNQKLGVFGRYSYSTIDLEPATPGVSHGNVNAQSYQLGLAFPDLGREGAIGVLSYTVPYSVTEGRKYLVSTGGDGGNQYELEATYFFPLSNNIAINPSAYVIWNPNNFSDNPTIYVGYLRMQFVF
jgi:hypothetical protein